MGNIDDIDAGLHSFLQCMIDISECPPSAGMIAAANDSLDDLDLARGAAC